MNDWVYWLIGLIVLSALFKIFKGKIKGRIGETIVLTILSALPKEEYRVLNNVMLKTERGTTQIDHVVVSLYGIFVIETKNYKGWITGTDNSEQWTQNMYGKKYLFRNPIKQNYGHVKALEKLLAIPENSFIPIVVFSVNADLKVKTDRIVLYTVKLKKKILKFQEKKFTNEQILTFENRIIMANVDSKENRKEHVEAIHKNIKEDKKHVKAGVCPKCGGRLTKRKGKYGEFTGCSNFPQCSYTTK